MVSVIRSWWQYITGKGREGKQGTVSFDPVCGLDVSDRPPLTSKFGKKTYYFCSQGCKNLFDRMPQDYM